MLQVRSILLEVTNAILILIIRLTQFCSLNELGPRRLHLKTTLRNGPDGASTIYNLECLVELFSLYGIRAEGGSWYDVAHV